LKRLSLLLLLVVGFAGVDLAATKTDKTDKTDKKEIVKPKDLTAAAKEDKGKKESVKPKDLTAEDKAPLVEALYDLKNLESQLIAVRSAYQSKSAEVERIVDDLKKKYGVLASDWTIGDRPIGWKPLAEPPKK
jgi:hypothetical protein